MARKSTTNAPTRRATTNRMKEKAVARDRVITFRISAEEAGLIRKAADRVPLARYSRDAVLARASMDAKK